MKNIFYIHGINSTALSFNYILTKLPVHNAQYLEYGFEDDIEKIVDQALIFLDKNNNKNFSIIGHSVGGLIAILSQFNSHNIDKIVTIAAPFGGCKLTHILKKMHPHYSHIINNLKTDSELIKKIKSFSSFKPLLSIVGTYGKFPKINEPNDGMMTVESQMSLIGPKYVNVNANHFEILMHDDTVDNIKKFIFNT